MGDDVMIREFPDTDQRRAICEDLWEEEDMEKFKKLANMQSRKKILALRADKDSSKNFGRDIVSVNGDTVDVYIYDVIAFPFLEAQDIVQQVPDTARTINLYINSPGGAVWEGLAIYNWLKDHSATKNVYIQGLAASMASVIALVGDSISIAKSAYMMVHDPWVVISGNADELMKEAGLLEKLEDTLADIYSGKSGIEKDTLRQWMHDETWMNGEEAASNGFATLTTTDEEMDISRFDLSMFDRVPGGIAGKKSRKQTTEGNKMNEKLKKMLEAKGLAADSTDEQAQEFLQSLLENGSLTDQEKTDLQAEKDQAVKDATKTEKDRQKTIRHRVQVAGLDDKIAEDLIEKDLSLEQAQEQIFAEMEKNNPSFGADRIKAGTDETDKYCNAATDGLLLKAGIKVEKPAAGADEFRSHEIASMIRDSLRRAGHSVNGLESRRAVADYVFRGRHQGALTTSDFPKIFRDAINKTLLRAYQESPATWEPWTTRTTASDFKTIYGVSLGNAPDLKQVREYEEYEHADLSEAQESYQVYKYGRIISLSWEMIINDDLRALTRYPQLMGNAARRKEADIVYALLTSNPTLNDGNSLFDDSNHSNYTASGAHVNSTQLDDGRKKMRKQTGLAGELLDLYPAFLLTPVEQETDAEVLMRSRGSTETQENSAVINPWFNRLVPIAEPRLDNDSTDAWYLIADPNQIDTIEVAYLDGYAQPTIDEQEEMTNDALLWKVRHVFGAGVMDYRAFYKNDGTGA